ncbi:DUF2306 domain-containing protein [Paraferrimonas sedimenticola]|uniref:DUF2306 domain-containing protein n=1 Tax=Paraferrimonas sedimenticola TaxID=375674 RepID=A0AA37RW82_9GAMM|nr:DUF2306 domain-containing protein [Paraferrimonas sedimenticola]GLP95867.1 hypothetical protein GCM10007895_11730 [Paraferrimonas sedimenticola]
MPLLAKMHIVCGLFSIISGLLVLSLPKGTTKHIWIGRVYAGSMLALNLTALALYRLTGSVNFFHLAALVSFITVVAAWWQVWQKPKGWPIAHGLLMLWSYVGLMAATAAEIASRVPGWNFGWSVFISSSLVIAIGAWLIRNYKPQLISRFSSR